MKVELIRRFVADPHGVLRQAERPQGCGRPDFDDLLDRGRSACPNRQVGVRVLPRELGDDALENALLRQVEHRRAMVRKPGVSMREQTGQR